MPTDQAACGVPGSLLAAWVRRRPSALDHARLMPGVQMVRLPRVGRKYSMACVTIALEEARPEVPSFPHSFFTAAAGVFLFGLTAATTLTQVNVLTSFAAFFEVRRPLSRALSTTGLTSEGRTRSTRSCSPLRPRASR